MKQINGEVRLLIIIVLLFVFLCPVGFLTVTTSSDNHDQDDILDTGGFEEIEEDELEPVESGDEAASETDANTEDNIEDDAATEDEATSNEESSQTENMDPEDEITSESETE